MGKADISPCWPRVVVLSAIVPLHQVECDRNAVDALCIPPGASQTRGIARPIHTVLVAGCSQSSSCLNLTANIIPVHVEMPVPCPLFRP